MSGKKRTCIVIVCDGCQEEHNHDYTPHWDSLAQGREETVDGYEWRTGGGDVDLCATCKLKPHTFVPETGDPDTCDRCGIERDEHEDAPDVCPKCERLHFPWCAPFGGPQSGGES